MRRRFFLQAAASMATIPALGERSGRTPPAVEPWLEGLNGVHKQFFDVASLARGRALDRVGGYLDSYYEAYGLDAHQLSVVFGAHSDALGFVLADSVWKRFELGAHWSITDGATGGPATRNPFAEKGAGSPAAFSVRELAGVRVRFLACKRSVRRLAKDLSRGTSTESVEKALLDGLLPGVFPVPAMTIAANRAQEAGLSYIYVGA